MWSKRNGAEKGKPASDSRRRVSDAGGIEGEPAKPTRPPSGSAKSDPCQKPSAILRGPRRSGRVAEGGALLRRYGGECLHRGFESLLLRLTDAEGPLARAFVAERAGF